MKSILLFTALAFPVFSQSQTRVDPDPNEVLHNAKNAPGFIKGTGFLNVLP